MPVAAKRMSVRASPRSDGSRHRKRRPATKQTAPPSATVFGAPIRSRERAGEQRAERRHPHEHHRVDRHHAAAQRVRDHRLDQRVRRAICTIIAHADRDQQQRPTARTSATAKRRSARRRTRSPPHGDPASQARGAAGANASASAPTSAPIPDAAHQHARGRGAAVRGSFRRRPASAPNRACRRSSRAPSSSSSARTGAVCADEPEPSAIRAKRRTAPPRPAAACGRRISSRPAMHREVADAVERRSTSPRRSPRRAGPRSPGPTIRAPLNIDEFSAIAFIRSSRPTMLDEERLPRRDVERVDDAEQRGEREDVPDADAAGERQRRQRQRRGPSTTSAWRRGSGAGRRGRRRCRRSGANRNTGIWPAKPTTPSSTAEPVRR